MFTKMESLEIIIVCMYFASEKLTINNNLSGAATHRERNTRILTKDAMEKGIWNLPS